MTQTPPNPRAAPYSWDLISSAATMAIGARIELIHVPRSNGVDREPAVGDSVLLDLPNGTKLAGNIRAIDDTSLSIVIADSLWVMKHAKPGASLAPSWVTIQYVVSQESPLGLVDDLPRPRHA